MWRSTQTCFDAYIYEQGINFEIKRTTQSNLSLKIITASAVIFLNLFGILSSQKYGDRIEHSAVFLLLNAVKLFFIIYFEDESVTLVEENLSTTYNNFVYSPFCEFFIDVTMQLSPAVVIIICISQMMLSRQNVAMLTNMEKFRKHVSSFRPKNENFNHLDKLVDRKMFWMASMQAAHFCWDFITAMQFSFSGLLAYIVLFYELTSNVIFAFYIYILTKFIINVQETALSYSRTLAKKTQNDRNAIIEEISLMRSDLFKIKENFTFVLSLQIFLLIFYFVQYIVAQVHTKWLNR